MATVEGLIAQSKFDEAVNLAEDLVARDPDDPDAKHILAVALVADADRMVVTDDESGRVKAAYYFEAISNDPGHPGICTGLLGLAETGQPSLDYPARASRFDVAPRAVAGWKNAVVTNPDLAKDEAVVSAVARLAAMAGERTLAADLRPDWLDAQMAAALDLIAGGERDRAKTYYGRAAKLDDHRTDVLVLGSLLGAPVPEMSAETVLDVTLPEHVRPGQILARAGSIYFSVENEGAQGAAIYRTFPGIPGAASPPESTVPEMIAEAGSPWFDVSADDATLAFGTGSDWGKPWEVTTLNLDTGTRAVLARTTGPVRGLAWSPDGRYLAYASQSGLFLVSSDGTGPRRLLEAKAAKSESGSVPAWPRWFGDGRRLLFGEVLWEGAGGTFIGDTVTGEVTELHRAETAHAYPSPDGRRVILTTAFYGASEESRAEIVSSSVWPDTAR